MNSIDLDKVSNEPLASQDTRAVKPSRLDVAAEQFEAMFLRQVLYQMRKAGEVLSSDASQNSKEMSVMRDMYDGVVADEMAKQKSLGIADMLVAQLGPKDIENAVTQEPMAARSSLDAPISTNWTRKPSR